ncbi:maleylacetoacetate isomerase [Veronia nyctiphanis]|uniref:Maleylacetoacetate isomerase n=1 Tax=Veronia nyctiphanis TaxID=1278244 RepID=A0A4Q0YTL4_9GAMM|nr:maleylacetoacetate isomerase [Veronia nyctiphanis]RXJ72341.1 maleylacetoacetate isomerase [Veronia nyctiphanis]
MERTLYDYSKSSASYRVRIALNLKGLDYEAISVPLLENAQRSVDYLQKNPAGLVPSFIEDSEVITQSLAILEYLEEKHPETALLPEGAVERARCRALALDIACDVHPLNNLRVLKYLTGHMGHSEQEKLDWYLHWLKEGLAALEAKLAHSNSRFCCGNIPTIADVCLVPQMFNARRFELDLSPYQRLVAIDAECQSLPAFEKAHPANV